MEHQKGSPAVALPCAIDAEKSVLSTCLQDPEDFFPLAIEHGVHEGTFFLPSHKVVWRTALEFYNKDLPVEMISLVQTLRDRDQLDNVGGPADVASIYTFAPTSAHFEHHLEKIKDKKFRREVLDWSAKVSEVAHGDDDLLPLLGKPVEDMLEATDSTKPVTAEEAMKDWLEDFSNIVVGGGVTDQFAESGIPTLDRIRGGLDKPGLTYVGALPSMGKTAFLLQMIANKLTQTDERVLMFSLEMTAKQLMQRLLVHLCKFESPEVLRGKVPPTKEDLRRIREKARVLKTDRLIIEEASGLDIAQIEARSKLEGRKGELGLIGVDYVQLVQARGHDGVEQRMTAVTHGLQRIMKTQRTSVVGLSQLTMEDGQPKLKYARSMEEDADLSLRLLGDEEEKRLTGIRVTKDRHAGQVGWYPAARFNKYKQTFVEENYR